MGCYVAWLRDVGGADASLGPTQARGFDGAPAVTQLTEGLVGEADLTRQIDLGNADWVISLEVGEHVPKAHETLLFATLAKHALRGVILSWSAHRGGRGHVNSRPLRYVMERMAAHGFFPDGAASKRLAASAKVAYWIGFSIMVYRRR